MEMCLGRTIKAACEPCDNLRRGNLIRARQAGGRHPTGPQLGYHFFPNLTVSPYSLEVHLVQRQSGRGGALVVTGEAVLFQQIGWRGLSGSSQTGQQQCQGAGYPVAAFLPQVWRDREYCESACTAAAHLFIV